MRGMRLAGVDGVFGAGDLAAVAFRAFGTGDLGAGRAFLAVAAFVGHMPTKTTSSPSCGYHRPRAMSTRSDVRRNSYADCTSKSLE